MSKKLLLMITILTMGSLSCMQAQNDVEVHLKGDLVTNYIWRGLNLGHVSVQPEMSVGWKGLSLSAWGSVGLSDKDDNSVIALLSAKQPFKFNELAALFPGTAYTDRGHHDFDSFPLGSVPRKDNKQV